MKGRLPNFIKSFLEDRTIQVRVGSTLSDLYDQEQGVPQGAILSTTLFNVKLNDIINCLDYKTDGSLYVDFYLFSLEKYAHNRKTSTAMSK